MGILNWVMGGSTRRTWRFSLAGRWLPAGAVMTGLVLLGGVVPASAQALTWSAVHSPNRGPGGNFLDAVSCVSAKMCMATGHRLNSIGALVTLAERWDGTSWSLVHSPNARLTSGNEFRHTMIGHVSGTGRIAAGHGLAGRPCCSRAGVATVT